VGVTRTYANENEEQPRGFVEFSIQQKDYKTVEKVFLCVMCFGADASMATLNNVFWEIHTICESLNTL